jgi:hypothetical protein
VTVDNSINPSGQVSVISVALASIIRGLRRGVLTCRFTIGDGEFQSTKPALVISIRASG